MLIPKEDLFSCSEMHHHMPLTQKMTLKSRYLNQRHQLSIIAPQCQCPTRENKLCLACSAYN